MKNPKFQDYFSRKLKIVYNMHTYILYSSETKQDKVYSKSMLLYNTT